MNSEGKNKNTSNRESFSPAEHYHRLELWKFRFRRFIRVVLWIIIGPFLGSFRRGIEWVIALCLILILFPVLIIVYPILRLNGFNIKKLEKRGQWNATIYLFQFDIPKNFFGKVLSTLRIHKIPILFNILSGDISFVGPRILSPEEFSQGGREKFETGNIRPGLITLWKIKQLANIDFENAFKTDLEYVKNRTLLGDFGMALRMIPATLYGGKPGKTADQLNLMGVCIDNITMDQTINLLIEKMKTAVSNQVCFVNADCYNIAAKDPEYRKVLKNADLVLADGIGVKLAGKLLKKEIKQNINGTDLFPFLCKRLEKEDASLYLLGARPGVVEKVAAWIEKKYPLVKIAGKNSGYFSNEQELEIINHIRSSGAKMLLVALGVPAQEKWIFNNLQKIHIPVVMGVGGLFDFYSGRISRAPAWIREIGLEWFYRFLQEPTRMWKRYFVGNTIFMFRVLKATIHRSQ